MYLGIINGLIQIIPLTSCPQIKLQLQINIEALTKLTLLCEYTMIPVILHAADYDFIHFNAPLTS
ncbi:hypothetical protein D1872_338630 [compost metagenome]